MGKAKTIVAVDVPGDLVAKLDSLAKSRGLSVELYRGAAAALAKLGPDCPQAILVGGGDNPAGPVAYEPFLHAAPHCPLVLLGRHESREQVLRALEQGVWMYCRQPYSSSSITDIINYTATDSPQPADVRVIVHPDDRIEFVLRCKVSAAERVTQILRDLEDDLPEEFREQVAAALWEMLLNAVEHGGHKDPERISHVVYERTATELRYCIRDPGPGFHDRAPRHAAQSGTPGEFPHLGVREELGMRPGGFGIFIARRLVDELTYNEEGNQVVLVKRLPV